MKKHAIIFASLALSCLVLSAPLSAGAVSSSQTEASSLYIITVQPELPVTERSELELTALEMTQTWQNPNPRRQLALKSVSRAGCSVYRWSSSAPVVASVDASGLVTALAPGKAVISAYTTQGETLTCTVTDTSEIGKVRLDADVLLLHSIGSQQDLIPTVAVQEPSAVALQWTSSDPSVAVVDADGTVTAVADGKAIVTVRTPEGRSAGCAVYVGQAAADYEKRDRQLTKAALGGMGILGALFLLLGIALAMYRRVDADKRANYKSMFISTALAVFLTGVTEPLEFMFMFCAMPLYIVYALLQGCAFAMAGIIHLRLHSFGNLEFITRIPMSLQAGLGGDIINFVICVVAFFVIGYFVAYFMIGKLQLATPGRLGNYTDDNADDSAADAKTEKKADKKADNGQAERIIALLGGRENIVLVDACMTRLRVTVKDPAKVADLAAWKAEGALSLLVKGDGIQAVYGPKADVLKSDINDIL